MEPFEAEMSAEQYRILKELDVDAIIRIAADQGIIGETRELALAGLHMARLSTFEVWSRKVLFESQEWLIEHGYKLDVE